jgi:hypothetical protein
MLAPEHALPVLQARQLVCRTHERDVAALPRFLSDRTAARAAASRPPPGPAAAAWRLASSHAPLLAPGGKVLCKRCFQLLPSLSSSAAVWSGLSCSDALAADARREAAVRPTAFARDGAEVRIGSAVLHASHRLFCFRGVVACELCGSYATSRPVALARPCCGHPAAEGTRVLRRLRAGLLPAALSAWPDSLPEASPLRVTL